MLMRAGSETYFMKLRFLADSYAMLITDMVNVWYCYSDPETVVDEKQVPIIFPPFFGTDASVAALQPSARHSDRAHAADDAAVVHGA